MIYTLNIKFGIAEFRARFYILNFGCQSNTLHRKHKINYTKTLSPDKFTKNSDSLYLQRREQTILSLTLSLDIFLHFSPFQ